MGYSAGGSRYLAPYSSAEHVSGELAIVLAVLLIIFIVYVSYRVRKQMEEDEAYLRKKRELISKWSRNTTRKMIDKLRKK